MIAAWRWKREALEMYTSIVAVRSAPLSPVAAGLGKKQLVEERPAVFRVRRRRRSS
jgi:hypothetical protein